MQQHTKYRPEFSSYRFTEIKQEHTIKSASYISIISQIRSILSSMTVSTSVTFIWLKHIFQHIIHCWPEKNENVDYTLLPLPACSKRLFNPSVKRHGLTSAWECLVSVFRHCFLLHFVLYIKEPFRKADFLQGSDISH